VSLRNDNFVEELNYKGNNPCSGKCPGFLPGIKALSKSKTSFYKSFLKITDF